jgi:toxin-antitoxin system PIN domain toxin
MAVLIDGNLLIGMAVEDHEHHEVAAHWFAEQNEPVATCPITQGTVVRHLVRNGYAMESGVAFLVALAERNDHEFWPDDLPYAYVPTDGVIGHRQVADAYLAQLARHHAGRVATMDSSFAASHTDVVELVPTS